MLVCESQNLYPRCPPTSLQNRNGLCSFGQIVPIIILSLVISLSSGVIPKHAKAQQPAKKTEIIDRAHFYKNFRKQFHRIKENQVHLIDRYERVFAYWDSKPHLKDLRWLAYILATTYHETGRRIKAVRECFGKTDQESINCVTRLYRRGRIKRNYAKIDPKTGKSYFGRGHVQLTWDWNYKRMGKELGMGDQVYINPDLALDRDTSVAILAEGMIKGLFTGKRLSKYFNKSQTSWGGARRIVNGLDKHKLIGGYGRKFYATLRTIPSGEPVADDCSGATIPQSCLKDLAAKVALLDSRFDELDTRYKNVLKDNVALKETVTRQQAELEQLNAEQPDIINQLSKLKASNQQLTERNTQLTNDQAELKQQNTKLASLNQELQTKLDDAITTGSTGTDGKILKERLDELEAQQKKLTSDQAQLTAKLEKADQDNKILVQKTAALEKRERDISSKLTDIEISREALHKRETNLLEDRKLLKQQEQQLDSNKSKLEVEEARIKRFEQDVLKTKKELEEYYSQSWYTRAWNSVTSVWRSE